METEIVSITTLEENVRKAERALEEARQKSGAATFTAMVNSMETNRLRAEADRAKSGLPFCGVLGRTTAEAQKLADKSNDAEQKSKEEGARSPRRR